MIPFRHYRPERPIVHRGQVKNLHYAEGQMPFGALRTIHNLFKVRVSQDRDILFFPAIQRIVFSLSFTSRYIPDPRRRTNLHVSGLFWRMAS
jgi:hypothetical protein